jgi:hypothetical protein
VFVDEADKIVHDWAIQYNAKQLVGLALLKEMRFLMVSATFAPLEESILRFVFSIIWGGDRFHVFQSVKDALTNSLSLPEIEGSQVLGPSEITKAVNEFIG